MALAPRLALRLGPGLPRPRAVRRAPPATLAGLASGVASRSIACGRPARQARAADFHVVTTHRCFEGTLFRCQESASFSVYVPDTPGQRTTLPYPEACEEFPVLLFLSDGSEDALRGNILEHCSASGLILVCPESSFEVMELLDLVGRRFPCSQARSLMGHGLGGSTALALAAESWCSVSVVAPQLSESEAGQQSEWRFM